MWSVSAVFTHSQLCFWVCVAARGWKRDVSFYPVVHYSDVMCQWQPNLTQNCFFFFFVKFGVKLMIVECFDFEFFQWVSALCKQHCSKRVVFPLRCRWSVPMMMSITHRGTGVGLSGGNNDSLNKEFVVLFCCLHVVLLLLSLCVAFIPSRWSSFCCSFWLTLKISSGHFSPSLLIPAKSIYWHYKTDLVFNTIQPLLHVKVKCNNGLRAAFSHPPGCKGWSRSLWHCASAPLTLLFHAGFNLFLS